MYILSSLAETHVQSSVAMLSVDRHGSLLFISQAQLISWLIQNWVYASFTSLSVCQSITVCATPRHDTPTCLLSSVNVPVADLGIPGCTGCESACHWKFKWLLLQTNCESHHQIPCTIYYLPHHTSGKSHFLGHQYDLLSHFALDYWMDWSL